MKEPRPGYVLTKVCLNASCCQEVYHFQARRIETSAAGAAYRLRVEFRPIHLREERRPKLRTLKQRLLATMGPQPQLQQVPTKTSAIRRRRRRIDVVSRRRNAMTAETLFQMSAMYPSRRDTRPTDLGRQAAVRLVNQVRSIDVRATSRTLGSTREVTLSTSLGAVSTQSISTMRHHHHHAGMCL